MEVRKLILLAGLSLCVGLPAQAATITVTETIDDDPAVDNGECSLREAVITANTNTQVDSCVLDGTSLIDLIVFDPSTDVELEIGSAASFLMALNMPGEDAAMTGDLDVLDDLRIRGNFVPNSGSDEGSVIAADGNDRVFHVLNNAFLELENVVVFAGGGVSTGGGIAVNAGSALTLRQAFLFGNDADSSNVIGAGGGIYSLGDVIIEESSFVGNRVRSSGTANLSGGAIAVTGALTITDSLLTTNELIATGDANASGGTIFALGNLSVTNSIVGVSKIEVENGQAHGGNIYFGDSGADVFDLRDSRIVAADIEVSGTGSARGVGLYHAAGQVNAERSSISNNSVRFINLNLPTVALGGGVFALDPVTLRNTTLTRNAVKSSDTAEGGAIYLGEMDASLTMNNVTAFGNEAAVNSGGGTLGRAGGISNPFGAMLTVSNSVIAGNDVSGSAPDCRGDAVSAGYNLIGDDSGCNFMAMAGTDLVGTAATPIDPLMVPDIDAGPQGVITLLIAPLEGSPALDAADMTIAMGGSCENEDQRGAARPQDSDEDGTAICEMGAYEGVIELPEVMFNDAVTSPTIRENQGTFTISDAVLLSEPVTFFVTVDIVFDAAASDAMLPADFDFMPMTVTFAPGETSADIEVSVVNDGVDEPDESVVFNLVNPSNATIGAPDSFTATLTDPSSPAPDDDDGCSGWEYLILCAGNSCSMGNGAGRFDPVLILILLLSAGYILRRSYIKPS